MELLLSSVVFDGPLRSGDMAQADLLTVVRDNELAGVELREAYWQGGEMEIDATISQLWAEEFAVVYATGDALAADDMESTLAGLDKMMQNLHVAAKMGAQVLRINAGMAEERLSFLQDRRYCEIMDRIAEESGELGVALSLENPPEPGAGSIMTLNWILTQFSFLHMTYDTANWLPAGENPLAALDVHAKRVNYVHLKDVFKEGHVWQFCGPGCGDVPFTEILDKLSRSQFAGYYALEFNGGENPRASLEKAVRFVKGLGARG